MARGRGNLERLIDVAELEQRLASLSPEKLALLQQRLKKPSLEDGQPIPSADPDRSFPTSFAQERLWFLDRMEAGNPAYNLSTVCRVRVPLDVDLLQRTLDAIAERHQTLRTRFVVIDGEPRQVVEPHLTIDLPIVDVRSDASDDAEAAAQQLVHADALRPFDLTEGPLVRASLLRLDDADHVLALTLHHIIADGWSLDLLWREIAIVYEALGSDRTPALDPLPIQYADYATWQRQWLRGEILASQLTYWTNHLTNPPRLMPLPLDRPRPARQSFAGAWQPFHVSADVTDRLRTLAHQEGSTLFMALLAAFATLLHRYTREEDLVIGCPTAGRTRKELEGLIGLFVNTLALRIDVSQRPSFRELLTRVRGATLGAFAHQEVPFEKVVEALQPERSAAFNPLFQVMFAMQPSSAPATTGADAVAGPTDGSSLGPGTVGTSKFDLTLTAIQAAHGLDAVFEYNTALFEPSTIARMTGHFLTLTQAIVDDPDRPCAGLPILTLPERTLLTVGWNPPDRALPEAMLLPERVEWHAAERPQAPALVFDGVEITYADLNARADRCASQLVRLGAHGSARVGLCFERSIEMIVAALGVMKSGGVFVPLDPSYPHERLAYMVRDAQPRVLLTQAALASRLSNLPTEVRTFEDLEESDAPDSIALSEQLPDRDRPAYVIYTSGSTGTPKGVVILHGALAQMLLATAPALQLSSSSRVLQFASFSFDAAIWEIGHALNAGATLCLAPIDRLVPGSTLTATLQELAITHVTLPPSVLPLLDPEAIPALDVLVTAGEACSAEAIAPWLGRTQCINAYGPTETTICASLHVCDADADGHRAPPIGRAIADTRLYVLDAEMEPVPIGVAGEIYIGGAGVSPGYVDRPALTASRFVRDRFSTDPAARLYRTGDLAKYLPDGEIHFLGRLDHQLKLHGYRIEAGEIESIARQLPSVNEALATVHGEPPSLVLYVAAPDAGDDFVGAVRTHLKTTLPQYMIPSTIVVLDALPRLPSGKVDRAALPQPDGSRPATSQPYTAPRSAVEESLCAIWATTLGVQPVGVLDDFFEIGGHSLLATRMLARVREAFGVDVPLHRVFDAPTVSSIAAIVESSGGQLIAARSTTIPAVSREERQSLPMSFAQERLWLLDQLQPRNIAYNISFISRVTVPLDATAVAAALDEIVRRHEVLRTRFALVDGQPTQIVLPHLTVPLPVTDLRDRPDDHREAAAHRLSWEETQKPFDVADGPHLRARLLRLGDADHVLVVCLHHIVADAWSMDVFTRELAALYDAFAHGRPSPLTPLPIQYADFAAWQRDTLQADALAARVSYWRERLRGAPALVQLPTDRPRPPRQSFAGATQPFVVSDRVVRRLRALGHQTGATLFMTLLAAFAVVLQRYTRQDDLVIGTPVGNRPYAELEGLIGFFVNSLALRLDLSHRPTFRELVHRVRGVTLEAFAWQDLPFEKLVEELQPERDLSYNPMFQVMFSWLTTSGAHSAGAVPTNHAGSAATDTLAPPIFGSAKFDLSLQMAETQAGVLGGLEYNTDLFDAETGARMTRHLLAVLEAVAADADRSVVGLVGLSESERLLVASWNATEVLYGRDTLQSLFRAQCARTPDDVAVAFGNRTLTYRQLDERSMRLARRLVALGAGPETLVGVAVERSLDTPTALLAILKTGAAYVPLDPSYPAARLAFMLRDAAAPVLVTQSHLIDRLPAHEARVVRLDDETLFGDGTRAESGDSQDDVQVRDDPSSLAYVIYTSGSTGRPKGVAVEHRAICNHMRWLQSTLQLTGTDRVLQKTPISFDASVWEFWAPLLSGARLVMAEPDGHKDAGYLVAAVVGHGITVLQLVPQMLQAILEEPAFDRCRSLRHVCCGGEPLSMPLVERFHARMAQSALWNLYGPTEAAIDATCWPCTPEPLAVAPIGRPIDNLRIHIVDDALEPVPIGVPGELCIAGVGLARGYVDRPALTAERFVADPFDGESGGRLYPTGDLARYRHDGVIEFLGRRDQQVKLRGFRIELGEIEATLGRHPAVSQAAVLVWNGDGSGPALVAYVTARPGQAIVAEDLRRYVGDWLPDYMVPSTVVKLPALPLSPSGKVDRSALPAPDPASASGPRDQTPPRNDVEELVAGIWSEVLGAERVGVHQNFFELGGHSLLATQVMSRLRRVLDVDLPLRRLFEGPTVGALAAALLDDAGDRDRIEKTATALLQLSRLSDDEVSAMLVERHAPVTP